MKTTKRLISVILALAIFWGLCSSGVLSLSIHAVPAEHVHIWNDGEVTKAPTCTEPGEKTYTCTDPDCGGTKTEELPAAHTLTLVPAVAATMLTEGAEAHYKCDVCGKFFADEAGTTEVTDAELVIEKLPIEVLHYANNEDGTYATLPGNVIYLSDLPFTSEMPPASNSTVTRVATKDKAWGGSPIAIGNPKTTFTKGFGTIPYEPGKGENYIIVDIRGQKADRFYAATGITGSAATPGDKNYDKYGVVYFVLGSKDGIHYEQLACSGDVMRQESGEFSVDVTGYNWLKLVTTSAKTHNYGCNNVWANASIYCIHSHTTEVEVQAATCTTNRTVKTVCDVCGETTVAEHEVPGTAGHTLTFVPTVAATMLTEGTKEHYKCDVCGKLFTDAEGTTEVTDAELVIPKLPIEVSDNYTPDASGSYMVIPGNVIYLSDLPFTSEMPPASNSTVTRVATKDKAWGGSPIAIGNPKTTFTKGFGTIPYEPGKGENYIIVDIRGQKVDRFYAATGITGSAATENHVNFGKYGVVYFVLGSKDGIHYEQLACSGDVMRQESGEFSVDVTGYNWLKLVTTSAKTHNYGCNNVWANASVYCAHSHTTEVEVQAAACTTNRTVKMVCDVCGEVTVAEHEVPDTALGHTMEHHGAVEATPKHDGNIEYWYCTACGKYYLDEAGTEETTAEGVVVKYQPCMHDWDEGEVTKEPTCTEKGVRTFTCSVCGETRTEEIPMKEHSWDEGEVTKEPTCTEEGVKTFTCSVCKGTKTEAIPVIPHTLTLVPAVAPTMLTEGAKEHYKCGVCGKLFADEAGTTEVTAAELVIPKLPIEVSDNYTPDANGSYMVIPGNAIFLSDLEYDSEMPPASGSHDTRPATKDIAWNGKTIAIGDPKTTFTKGLGTIPYNPGKGENFIIVDIREQKVNRFYAATGITGSAATPGNTNEGNGVVFFVLGSKDGVTYEQLACSGSVIKQASGEFCVDITGYGWLKLITVCAEENENNWGCDNAWANACVYCTHPEMEHHKAVEATPEADGNLEYWYCPACGKYYLDEAGTEETTAEGVVVKYQAHVHTWNDGEVTREPTCTEPGEKILTCTDPDCGETRTEEIPATGHKLTHVPAVAPTTEKDGNIEHWRCSVCGTYYLDAAGTKETTEDKVILPARPKPVNFLPSDTGSFTTALPDAALYPDADLDKSPFDYDSYSAYSKDPKAIVNSTVKIGADQVTYSKGFRITPAAPSAERQAYILIHVGDLDVNRFFSGVGINGSASNPTNGNYDKYGVVFYVYGSKDGEHYEQLACSGDIYRRESGEFNVDITGYKWLKLTTVCAGAQNWGCESTWVNACLYKYEEGHVHTLEKVDRVEPTMLTEGTKEHYKCACGKIFADAEGTQELTPADLVLEKLAIAASNYTNNTDGIYMSIPGSVIFLSDLPFDSAMPPKNGAARPAAKDTAFGGSAILIGAGKVAFSKGFGTLPAEPGTNMNYIFVDIDGKNVDRFYAATGITGSAATPSSGNYGKYGVVYFVLGTKDGIHYEQLACSGAVMQQESGEFNVDITGYKRLKLVTACAGTHNYGCDSVWANACVYNSQTTDLKPALQEDAYASVDAPTGINPKDGTLVWLSDLTYESCKNNNSADKLTVSDAQYGTDGAALTVGDKKTFQKGLGVHPNGETVYDLSGMTVDTLYAVVGITNPKGRDGASEGVIFSVYADYGDGIFQLIARSNVILNKSIGEFRVNIQGARKVKLVVAAKGAVTSSASAWAGACVYQTDPNAALDTQKLLKTATPESPRINFDPAKNFKPIQDGNYMKLPKSVSYLSDLAAEALKSYATPDSKGNARGAKRDLNWSGGSSVWLGNCSVSFTKGLSIVPSPDGKPDAYILADISGLEGHRFYAAVGITGSAATENHANFGQCGIVCYVYGSKEKTDSTNPADYDLLACSGALLMRESGEFDLNVSGYKTLLLVTDSTHKNNYGCDMFWGNAAVYQPEGAAEPFKGSRFQKDAFTANSGTFAGMAFPAKGDVIYLSGIPSLESSNSLSDAYPAGDPTALNRPFGAASGSGFTLGSSNTKFQTGLGMYPKDPAHPVNGSINSWTIYDLSEIHLTHFYAAVGLTDPSADGAGVIFRVFGDYSGMGDYMMLAQSDVLKGNATGEFNLKITGIKHLMLVVVSAGESNANCGAAWADACVYTANEEDPQKPTQPDDPQAPSVTPPTEEKPNTEPGSTGFPWALIYIAAIAVCGGIGAGVAWLVKRKKNS